MTAPWRGKVIEKGVLGPGFLSHLITERFARHQPYYRLEGKYRAEGLELSRSVLCESVARCAELLEPIAEQLKNEVLASSVVHTDNAPVPLAMPQEKAGSSRQARLWAYLNGDGRQWYEFSESRKRDGPARVFKDFTGYLQAAPTAATTSCASRAVPRKSRAGRKCVASSSRPRRPTPSS